MTAETNIDINTARTLANIAKRAETLFKDGYSYKEMAKNEHSQTFMVTTPNSQFYTVRLSDTPDDELFGDYCSCPSFTNYSTCKHYLAVNNAEMEKAIAAKLDAIEPDAADDDPYAEF